MRKIICAFYNPAVKNFDGYNSLMSVIVENRKKIRPIYFEEVDGQFLIVFYEDRLKKIEKYPSGEALKQYEKIDEKYRQCAVCQCKYLSYHIHTAKSAVWSEEVMNARFVSHFQTEM